MTSLFNRRGRKDNNKSDKLKKACVHFKTGLYGGNDNTGTTDETGEPITTLSVGIGGTKQPPP